MIIYLLIINAVALILMFVDKFKARKKFWRISEKTLIGSALLGGSIGALIGMYVFRHKTRHPKFTMGIPLILALQIVAAVLWAVYF